METVLTPKSVFDLGMSLMFDDEYIEECKGKPPKELWAEGGGIVRQIVFDKRKITEDVKNKVKDMISQLSDKFFSRDGESFIQMPFTKDGKQWGEQKDAELLLAMAKAMKFAEVPPRIFWPTFPGSVPMVNLFMEERDWRKQTMDTACLSELMKLAAGEFSKKEVN